MMVREENQKTIYTRLDDDMRLWIIPDTEFRKQSDESSPSFTGTHFLQFEDAFKFIEVMDDSKILFIGFNSSCKIYNIEKDPFSPQLIRSYDFNDKKMVFHLKVDENLILL